MTNSSESSASYSPSTSSSYSPSGSSSPAGSPSGSGSGSGSASASSSDGAPEHGSVRRCVAALAGKWRAATKRGRGAKRDHYAKQKAGKKGASMAGRAIDPTGIGGRVQAGMSLGKSMRKVAKLRDAATAYRCTCDDQACPDVLVYAVTQKEKKCIDKVASVLSIPVLTAVGKGIYRGGRNLYKRYKGELHVHREEMAEDLYYGCAVECPLGERLVSILVGRNYVGEVQTEGGVDDWRAMLMDKMASQ